MEGRGHRVVEERIDSSTKELVEESSIVTDSTSWPSTFETDIMDNEILETVDYVKSNPEIATTTPAAVDEVIFELKISWNMRFIDKKIYPLDFLRLFYVIIY